MARVVLHRHSSGVYLPYLPDRKSAPRWGFVPWRADGSDNITFNDATLAGGALCVWSGEKNAFPPADWRRFLQDVYDNANNHAGSSSILFYRAETSQIVPLAAVTLANGTVFQLDSELSLVYPRDPSLRTYDVFIPSGTKVQIDSSASVAIRFKPAPKKIGLGPPGLNPKYPIDGALRLFLGSTDPQSLSDYDATLQFDITLNRASFAGLGLGLRYSWPQSNDDSNQAISTVDFIALEPPGTNIVLNAVIDPATHREGRSFFAIPPTIKEGRKNVSQILAAPFPTTHGVKLLLSPRLDPEAARFVFILHARTRKPGSPLPDFSNPGTSSGSFSFNLAPTGAFDLNERDPQASGRGASVVPLADRTNFGLLTGLSDREFIQLRAGDWIHFRPDGPAYDPDWAQETAAATKPRLYADFLGQRTSWLSVFGRDGESTTLISEAADFALYSPVGNEQVLRGDYNPIPLRVPTASSAALGLSLPAIPYLGVDVTKVDEELLRHLEKRTVAPFRRGLVEPIPGTRGENRLDFTPLGFLVERTAGDVTEIRISKNQSNRAAVPPAAGLLIRKPSRALVDVLERDELFMVITGIVGTDGVIDALLDIAEWGFIVKPPTDPVWDPTKPVIIIKGARGKLGDLLKYENRWAGRGIACPQDPAVFGANEVNGLLRHDTAGNDEAGKALTAAYRRLDEMLADPEWMGVLVLNCGVNAEQLPEQVLAVLGGIDSGNFRTHHLGIRLNRLEGGGTGNPDIGTSPMFGAIDYNDRNAKPTDQGSGYDIKVRRLVVGFASSRVHAFFAEVLFLANKFFETNAEDTRPLRGTKTRLADKNIIVIYGSHESRLDPAGKVVDIYKFVAQVTYAFNIKSSFVKKLVCERITLSTGSSVPIGGKSKRITARLGIDGTFTLGGNFPTTSIYLLKSDLECKFIDLGIELDFEIDTAPSPWTIKWNGIAFRPRGLQVDLSKLPLQTDGVLKHFPFKFRTFEFWDQKTNLAKLGYFKLTFDENVDDEFKYGLSFDLDLGSLGALGSKLKDFQFRFLIGWREDNGDTKFCIGFRFDGAGGSGLDIGIGNIFRLKASGYGLSNIRLRDSDKGVYVIYAEDLKLVIFDKTIPSAKFSIFIFVDPNQPGQVGWFMLMRSETDQIGGIIDLNLIAGGQRVDPFAGAGSTAKVKDLIELWNPAKNLSDADEVKFFRKVLDSVSNGKPIKYDPASEWSLAFDANLFAASKFLQTAFQVAVRDPNLYGLRLGLDQLGIDIDVVYRKLSEDLGVYSIEFALPEGLRRFDAGPVTIKLPSVGIDIYTDGGFRIDLGFPFNHNFARAFIAEVFPFTGSGGLYFARISGRAARLVPQIKDLPEGRPRKGGSRRRSLAGLKRIYEYNPVVEVGLAASVGLGKSIDQGIFTAEAKIEIYGFLEGAQGIRRQLPDTTEPSGDLQPAPKFTAVRGTIGVHGHIEGRVDFGVTRARAWADAYIELVILIRTDDHIPLTITARVSLGFEWVIARVETFFGTFEVSIHLSFETTISYTWVLGDRRANFTTIYDDSGTAKPIVGLAAMYPSRLTNEETNYDAIAWAAGFVPAYWTGSSSKVGLTLLFNPDISFADAGFDGQGHIQSLGPAVLPFVWGETGVPDSGGGATPMEKLVIALSAWAAWSVLKGRPGFDPTDPLHWTLKLEHVLEVSRRMRGGDERYNVRTDNPDAPTPRGPGYDAITQLLENNFDITIRTPESTDGPRPGALFPLPSDLTLVLADGYGQVQKSVNLWNETPLVTDGYEATLRKDFNALAIEAESREGEGTRPARHLRDGRAFPSLLFEEHFELLLRGGVQGLVAAWKEVAKGKTTGAVPTLGEVLAQLGLKHAAQAVAFGTRFLLHGLRVRPAPERTLSRSGKQVSASKVDSSALQMIASGGDVGIPIYAAAGVQQGLTINDSDDRQSTSSVTVKPKTGVTWFAMSGPASARINLEGVRAQRLAFGTIQRGTLGFGTTTVPGWTRQFNRYAPLRELKLGADIGLMLPPELVENSRVIDSVEAVEPDGTRIEAKTFSRAVVVPIRLRQVPGLVSNQSAMKPVAHVYEIVGAVEEDRRLLDRIVTDLKPDETAELFAQQVDGGETSYQAVTPAPLVMRGNLSVEPGLDTGQGDFSARAADLINSASLSETAKFVNLVRFASVVNSGGFYLVSTSSAIEDVFTQTPDPNKQQGPSHTPTVLLVVRHGPMGGDAAGANALLVNTGTAAGQLLDGGKAVAVLTAGRFIRSATLPGLVRLCVNMDDPRHMYSWINNLSQPVTGEFGDVRTAIIIDEGLNEHDPNLEQELQKRYRDPKRGVGMMRADLLTRYTMLDFAVEGSDFDPEKARLVLPVGPTKLLDCPSPKGKLGYLLPIPLAKFLKADDGDPYGAIGKRCSIRFTLRDVYGNRLGITGSHNIDPIKFTDPLAPFWGVAGMSLSFDVDPGARGLVVNLFYAVPPDLQPPKTPPAPGGDREILRQEGIRAVLRDLDTSWQQLFTPAEWEKKNATLRSQVSLWLRSTLIDSIGRDDEGLPEPGEMQISDSANATKLRDFLKLVRKKLQDALPTPRARIARPRPIVETAQLTISLAKLPTADFVPVLAALAIRREITSVAAPDDLTPFEREMLRAAEADVPPAYLGDLAAPQVRQPRRAQTKDPRDEFGKRLEQFPGQDKYRAAFGRAPNPGAVGETVWLVSKRLDTTILLDDPIYAAPLPLANTPVSLDLEIPTFDSNWNEGPLAKANIRDADMDDIGREMAARIDQVVSPRILGRLLAEVPNRESDLREALDKLLRCKEAVADYLSLRVAAIRPAQVKSFGAMAAEVTRDFKERLRRRLSNYFNIDAVVCHGLKWRRQFSGDTPYEAAPHFHIAVDKAETARRSRRLADANGPDFSTDAAPVPITSKATAFSVFFGIDPLQGPVNIPQGDVPLLNADMIYKATHVQRLRYPQSDNAAMEKRVTQWLRLRQPIPLSGRPGKVGLKVPILVRNLPQRPTIVHQAASPITVVGSTFKKRIELARQWQCQIDWGWERRATDTLITTVEYNTSPQAARALAWQGIDDNKAREGIFRFVASANGPLWELLTAIGAGEIGNPQQYVNAFRAFARVAERLAIDLAPRLLAAAAPSAGWQDQFEVGLKTSRRGQKLTINKMTWGNKGSRARTSKPVEVGKYGTLSRDAVSVSNIDIMEGASAWAQVTVKRYPGLNPVFTYTVDGIRAGDAVVAELFRREEEFDVTDNARAAKAKPAEDWLKAAFSGLLEESDAALKTAILVDVEAAYQTGSFGGASFKDMRAIRGAHPPGTPVMKLIGFPVSSTVRALSDNSAELAKLVAAQTSTWLAHHHVPIIDAKKAGRRYDGQIRFRVSVFSPTEPIAGVPILKVENLLLPLKAVLWK